ncbi:MAG TPA: hypothetical protein VK629_12010, partial [Steroidobacteraceae bacterium]|nr:hypothetical protein [Steroidobacteraceae bacterium]
VTELARQHTEAAITALAEILTDEKANRLTRIAAANALLDRGWGKPLSTTAIIEEPRAEVPLAALEAARRLAFALTLADRHMQGKNIGSYVERFVPAVIEGGVDSAHE